MIQHSVKGACQIKSEQDVNKETQPFEKLFCARKLHVFKFWSTYDIVPNTSCTHSFKVYSCFWREGEGDKTQAKQRDLEH